MLESTTIKNRTNKTTILNTSRLSYNRAYKSKQNLKYSTGGSEIRRMFVKHQLQRTPLNDDTPRFQQILHVNIRIVQNLHVCSKVGTSLKKPLVLALGDKQRAPIRLAPVVLLDDTFKIERRSLLWHRHFVFNNKELTTAVSVAQSCPPCFVVNLSRQLGREVSRVWTMSNTTTSQDGGFLVAYPCSARSLLWPEFPTASSNVVSPFCACSTLPRHVALVDDCSV